jgi:hypothetical protein
MVHASAQTQRSVIGHLADAVHDAALVGADNGLHAVAHSELRKHALDMAFDGRLGLRPLDPGRSQWHVKRPQRRERYRIGALEQLPHVLPAKWNDHELGTDHDAAEERLSIVTP